MNQDAKHNYAIEIDDTNAVTCEIGNGSTFDVVKSTTRVVTGQFGGNLVHFESLLLRKRAATLAARVRRRLA